MLSRNQILYFSTKQKRHNWHMPFTSHSTIKLRSAIPHALLRYFTANCNKIKYTRQNAICVSSRIMCQFYFNLFLRWFRDGEKFVILSYFTRVPLSFLLRLNFITSIISHNIYCYYVSPKWIIRRPDYQTYNRGDKEKYAIVNLKKKPFKPRLTN